MGIALDSSPDDLSSNEASPVDPATLRSDVHRARRRANLVLALLILQAFCYAAWLGTGAIKLFLAYRGLPVASASDDEILPIELVEGFVVIPVVLLLFASLVAWFFWLHRAYENLRWVGLRSTTYTTRWAIGSWFVPFANLIIPYRVVVDLTLRSEDGNTWNHSEDSSGPGRVLAWWLLTFLSRVIDRIVVRGPDLVDLSAVAFVLLDMTSTVIYLVWVALCFLIVRHIRDAQDRWLTTVEPRLEPAAV